MNRKTIAAVVVGLSLVWTGCWQKSVHPFYLDDNVVFEQRLIGTWMEQKAKEGDDPQSWSFSEGPKHSYQLEIHDGDENLEFDAHLFELGEARFLDLYSRRRAVSEIPAHHLFRVGKIGSSLELQILSGEWIMEWIEEHPKGIAHVKAHDPEKPEDTDKGEIILTAGTKALQGFVLAHLDDEGFFDESGEFRRAKIGRP